MFISGCVCKRIWCNWCHLGVQNLCVLIAVAMSGLPNVCYNWYHLGVLKPLRPYGGCDVCGVTGVTTVVLCVLMVIVMFSRSFGMHTQTPLAPRVTTTAATTTTKQHQQQQPP